MAYRPDADLAFLACLNSSRDLDELVKILTINKEGEDELPALFMQSAVYQEHYPDHLQYWQLLAEQIQLCGANGVVSLLRGGKGVLYREILLDVAGRMKIKVNKDAATAEIEHHIMRVVFKRSLESANAPGLGDLLANPVGTVGNAVKGAVKATSEMTVKAARITLPAVLEIIRLRSIYHVQQSAAAAERASGN